MTRPHHNGPYVQFWAVHNPICKYCKSIYSKEGLRQSSLAVAELPPEKRADLKLQSLLNRMAKSEKVINSKIKKQKRAASLGPPASDTDLGCKLAHALLASLPASAKDAWLSAQDGCRCFLPYKVTIGIANDPTDWESLRAAVGVLRVVVPVVCDVWVGQPTAE